ncbi:MAG: hypothetical protein HY332_10430 [Chloroflexi bacterium]|nr:hypothetical protein [Chloroflexota bacterium]
MIAMDLARELKVAGLPWRPRRGDLAMDRLNVAYLVLSDGTDDAGGVEIDTGRGVERRPFLGLTWLPRLDQILAVLARHGPLELTARPAGQGRRDYLWRLTLSALPVNGSHGGRYFEATVAGDAAGLALHHLLVEVGWKPGKARNG